MEEIPVEGQTLNFILSKRIKIELDFNLLQYSNANIIIEAYLEIIPHLKLLIYSMNFRKKIIKVDIDGNIPPP